MVLENNAQGEGGDAPRQAAPADYSQLMVTMAHTMAMQSAIGSVPPFDGTNIPLKDFIQDVRNAAADITDDQLPCFLKKVLGKLRGSARNSTFGVSFETVDDLVRHLKRRFAPGKTYTYYLSQLNDLRMKQGDTVGDFCDRLNILLMGAENALKEDKGRAYVAAMMLPMKEAAIDIFIRGLPGNISAAVDASHPADLESAYKEAVRIEARIRSRILPESRQSAQLGQYAEQGELSQNMRPRTRFYPAFTPSGGVRNQPPESGLGSGPTFVGYLETEVPVDNNFEESALIYPETDPSFIGYVTPGVTYQPPGPQTPLQPQDSRNATHQGYPPRRGRGGRGGYYGQGRPNMYADTRLYDPHASSHQTIDQGRAASSYSPLNNGMANLNLQGARPHPPTASPAITLQTQKRKNWKLKV